MLNRLVVGAFALSVTGTLASAQAPVLGAPGVGSVEPPASAGRLFVGAGYDVAGGDNIPSGGTFMRGMQFGYERRVGGAASRYALRLMGEYLSARSTLPRGAYAPTSAESAPFRRSVRLYGANLLGVMELRTHGLVRPYALAGGGVYQFVGTNRTGTLSGGDEVALIDGDHGTGFASTVGVGMKARVGAVEPFAELRLVRTYGMRTDNISWLRVPLNLGVRVRF